MAVFSCIYYKWVHFRQLFEVINLHRRFSTRHSMLSERCRYGVYLMRYRHGHNTERTRRWYGNDTVKLSKNKKWKCSIFSLRMYKKALKNATEGVFCIQLFYIRGLVWTKRCLKHLFILSGKSGYSRLIHSSIFWCNFYIFYKIT